MISDTSVQIWVRSSKGGTFSLGWSIYSSSWHFGFLLLLKIVMDADHYIIPIQRQFSLSVSFRRFTSCAGVFILVPHVWLGMPKQKYKLNLSLSAVCVCVRGGGLFTSLARCLFLSVGLWCGECTTSSTHKNGVSKRRKSGFIWILSH